MDKTKQLGTLGIGKLLAKYSIPAIIAMLVNAIYNVIDRIFIGQYVGEEALAGLTISFPVMLMIFAFASLIGAGGSALLAIRLGEKDEQGASHVFGNALSFGIIITAIALTTIFLNLDSLLVLFGATPDVLVYASSYMTIIIAGFIFQMISFILNSSVRAEGRPMLSMLAMMSSAITNIILDYIFIVIFAWGVEGAAFATIAGQFVGLMILLSFYLRRKSVLHLSVKDFIPDLKVIGNIVMIGSATFITTIGTSVAMTFLNRELGTFGGTAAITSMGAINSLYTLFIMPIMGITQGMQPIIGYNYGAKEKKRVNRTLVLGMIIAISFSSIVFVLLQVFPITFVSMFLEKGSATIDVAVNGLRIFIIMLPLLSINIIGVAYYQSTARGKTSIVLGMLRQFVFLLPILLILPNFMGLNGVWLATPIADGFAVLVTIIFLLREFRKEESKTNIDSRVSLEIS